MNTLPNQFMTPYETTIAWIVFVIIVSIICLTVLKVNKMTMEKK